MDNDEEETETTDELGAAQPQPKSRVEWPESRALPSPQPSPLGGERVAEGRVRGAFCCDEAALGLSASICGFDSAD